MIWENKYDGVSFFLRRLSLAFLLLMKELKMH